MPKSPRELTVAVSPKPLNEMTDDEIMAWSAQVHAQMVEQDSQES